MLGRRIRAVVAAVFASVAPLAAAQAEDAVHLHIGWAQAPGHLAPLLDILVKQHPEIFPHYAKSYTAEAVRFNGSTPQIQAIAVGELEVAAFAPSSMTLAVTNANLDVKIVADVIQDGRPGYYDEPFIVKKDGPIKTIDDVRGKRVATNTIGSASDNAMRMMLRRHNILDADFTTIETNFANMFPMIEGGKVDLIGGLPQYLHQIWAAGRYRTLYTAGDARGPAQGVVWAMRSDFIAAHRAALVDFLEDHIRAVRWLLDPRNRHDALAVAALATKQKPEELDYAFTTEDFYRSPDCMPDVAAAQKEIDESVKLGLLPKGVELAPRYVDLSLIEEAKARIDG